MITQWFETFFGAALGDAVLIGLFGVTFVILLFFVILGLERIEG